MNTRFFSLPKLMCAALPMLLAFGAAQAAEPPGFVRADNGTQYYPYTIDEDALAGAPDHSALNRPLTPGARLVIRDGHFFTIGPDGRTGTTDDVRTRLFGISLSFGANFPSADDAVRLARRLRKLGFNAVRLHHMDSLPSNETNSPQSLLTLGPYPSFNPVALQRLRYLIDALGREGIYVDLNLHVGYRFRSGIDNVPAFNGDAKESSLGAPVHVYHPRMIALQETYARQLIRSLKLRGNPVLAMVEINNESSLLSAWQRRQWNDALPAAYAPVLEQQWQDWLVRRYGSTTAACAAWAICARPDAPVPLLTPTDAELPGNELGRWIDKVDTKLRQATGRRPAPRLQGSDKPTGKVLRTLDFLHFLTDTDKAYFDRLRAVVHEETDAQVPVTGTQMAFGGVLNFDSQAEMDYIDEHIYVAHPVSPNGGWNNQDWRIADLSATGPELNRLLALSLRRDARKPFVVSEFNQPFPNPRGAEILPVMAIVGALQDWDGLFFFDYRDGSEWPVSPMRFSLSGEWGKLALAGQSAVLFRTGAIPSLAQRLDLPLPQAARDRLALSARPDAFESDAARRLGVAPEQAWRFRLAQDLSPTGTEFTGPAQAETPFVTPDGSIRYDAAKPLLTLSTGRAWGVFGDTGGRAVDGPGLTANVTGPASLLLTPLDGETLARSGRMLLGIGSATAGTQPGSRPPRPKEVVRYRNDAGWLTLEPDAGASGPSGSRSTRPPSWLARSDIQLTLPAVGRTIAIYPLNGDGSRRPALGGSAVQRTANGMVNVRLQAEATQASPWYEIVIGAGPVPQPESQP